MQACRPSFVAWAASRVKNSYPAAQYRRLAQVTRALLAAYPSLRSEAIVGHSDIAPGRKTDPGPHFDWPRYRAALVTVGGRGFPVE